jgi:large subunit ribosomal protein L35Ae
MKALVIQFRRGRKNYTPRHFLIEIESVDSREKAAKFVGKLVEWTSPGKEKKVLKGKVSAPHGNKGLVRAIFETGLPGQAIGTECEIKDGGKA